MHIDVREEEASDLDAIRAVNKRAFGQDHEADIVDALRSNGAASLSLVATVDSTVAGHVVGHVVGHIMYSPVAIGPLEGIGLGPVAVLPEYQRRGIGSVLVETGNRRLELARCPFIVVLGHPTFYPRFGFRPAGRLGISCEWDVPDDVFQILVLDSVRMAGVSGVARYRREFSTGT
jgi:putative acetyltransferase